MWHRNQFPHHELDVMGIADTTSMQSRGKAMYIIPSLDLSMVGGSCVQLPLIKWLWNFNKDILLKGTGKGTLLLTQIYFINKSAITGIFNNLTVEI